MTALVVILLAVAASLAAGSLITRVHYLRNHPAPAQCRMRRWLIGLVVLAAASGIGIGMATSGGTTTADVVKAVVLLALVAAYASWRFGSSKDAKRK